MTKDTSVDSLFAAADALYARSDAMERGNWSGVADAAPGGVDLSPRASKWFQEQMATLLKTQKGGTLPASTVIDLARSAAKLFPGARSGAKADADKRADASVSSMSGAQLTRHGEELAREKKRLEEKLRGAKSKGDEERAMSELKALRKQIDEWHRETTRGDAKPQKQAVAIAYEKARGGRRPIS